MHPTRSGRLRCPSAGRRWRCAASLVVTTSLALHHGLREGLTSQSSPRSSARTPSWNAASFVGTLLARLSSGRRRPPRATLVGVDRSRISRAFLVSLERSCGPHLWVVARPSCSNERDETPIGTYAGSAFARRPTANGKSLRVGGGSRNAGSVYTVSLRRETAFPIRFDKACSRRCSSLAFVPPLCCRPEVLYNTRTKVVHVPSERRGQATAPSISLLAT